MALRGRKGDANFTITATDSTKKGLAQAQRRIKQTTQKLRRMGTIAGGIATASLVTLTRQGLKSADELAKLSDQLGIATESLSGLRLAADRTGPGAAKLDAGLGAMTKRLGEAAQGSGEAGDALDQLGLNISDIINLSPDEQFYAIADAMQGVENVSMRNAIAADLFSRSNQALVNTLLLGEDALRKVQEEAEAMGLALNRVDAAKVEAANDAMADIMNVVKGISQRIAVALAPALEAISNYLVDASIESKGFSDQIDSGMDLAVKGVAMFANGLHGLKVIWQGLKVIALGVVSLWTTSFELLVTGIAKLRDKAAGAINDLIRAFNKIPGVDDIPLLQSMEEGGFVKSVQEIGSNMRETLMAEQDKLHQDLMKPLPGDQIKAAYSEAVAASQEAAEEVARNREKLRQDSAQSGLSGPGEDNEGRQKVLQGIAEENQARMQLMRERYFGEEMIRNEYQERLDMMEMERRNNDLISTRQFNQAKLNELRSYMSEQYGVQTSGYDALTNMVGKNWNVQSAMVADAFGTIINTMSSESRKAFEIQKALSLATAAINAYEAITGAYKFGASIGGPVLGAAMAAAAGAAQFAQISKIAKQSFNGGASKSSGGGGGGGVATSGSTASGSSVAVDNERRRREEFGGAQVTVNIPADELTNTNTIRSMLERLDEVAQDTPLRNIRVQSP